MASHRPPSATVNWLPDLPILGLTSATSGAAGAVVAFALPELPAWWLCVSTLCVGLFALAWAPRWRPLAAFALGLAWTCVQGTLAMAERLPAAFEGADQRVEFRVAGLPKAGAANLRFDARILDGPLQGRRVRLGWYGGGAELQPGSRWSATVRLKRPRGTVNPGGFDFERHALERGLAATGYVRESPAPRLLAVGSGVDALRARVSSAIGCAIDGCGAPADAASDHPVEPADDPPSRAVSTAITSSRAHVVSRHAGVTSSRAHVVSRHADVTSSRSRVATNDTGFAPSHAAVASRARFVQALALGDTRALDEHDWEVLRATGVAHLIAISGLHVGLVAGFGALLMRGLHRAWPGLGLRLPLPQSAALGALVAASGYTALAGFALPTVRTLLMIAAALLGVLLRRAAGAPQAFALSLIAMLVFDPLGLLGAGFWLSFVGVAWLLWCLPRERAVPTWRALLSAQGVMTVSLLPLGVWFFGQASIVGPFTNLLAVPWVSFVVVPVALGGVACELAFAGAGQPFFIAAAWLMDILWWTLERAAAWRGSIAYLPEPTPVAFVFALLASFWLLLPRGVPGKRLAAFLMLPLAWPRSDALAEGEADILLIDVGQGLSLLVRTRAHALLYDAGPAFAGGLDQGDAAVVPALRALGVRALDAYVESHGHNDHAGGTGAVLRAFAPPHVFASDPGRRAAACHGRWAWDGVKFEFLHPPPDFPYLDNDSSCVLRVVSRGGSLLIPGDISAVIEARLLREHDLRSDVVVMPHHGSRTSSSPEFVRATAPSYALIGAGHGNRFGLPRADVVQRWRAAGAQVLQTADRGAISLRIRADGVRPAQSRRRSHPRWWREE